jgi:hypothetical protein
MAVKRSFRKYPLSSLDKVIQRRDKAAAQLVAALATLLVPTGVTPKRFGDLAKRAFVEVAAAAARMRNGKVNHSKVAVLTGLSRLEVKRLLSREFFARDERGTLSAPVERIIEAWISEPDFSFSAGRPRRLRITGRSKSFADLVKRHGGDVTHRAVLDELQRLGAARRSPDKRYVSVVLEAKSNWNRISGHLSALTPIVVDAINSATDSTFFGQPPSISRVRLYARDPLELTLIRERVGPAIQTLVTGLRESLKGPDRDPEKHAAYALTMNILLSGGPRRKNDQLLPSSRGTNDAGGNGRATAKRNKG